MNPKKKSPHWLPYLDGWRAVAVLCVLIGHFTPVPHINAGRFGVEMFFCLSGRLMAEILFVRHMALRPFLERRVARVWPALWVFVLVLALGLPKAFDITPLAVLGALTFTENYFLLAGHGAGAFAHLWSLAIEEWAYVTLALIALASRIGRFSPLYLLFAIAGAAALAGIIMFLAHPNYYYVYWRTEVRISSILVPCLVVLLLRQFKVPRWLPVAAGVCGLLLNTNPVPDPFKYTLGTVLMSVSVAKIDVAYAWVKGLLSWRPLRLIGLWSFSIYLWQQPFYLSDQYPVALRLAAVMIVSVASYYAVEQPARKWLNRRFRAGQSNASVAEAL